MTEITVVAPPPVAELFRFHPDCNRVLVYDKKGVHRGISGRLRFVRNLRRQRFDMAILFQNAIEAAVMASLAGIPKRFGYRTDGRALLLTKGVPVGRRERRLHHVRYYLHMLDNLGIPSGPATLRLACRKEELDWSRELSGGAPVAVINPGATYGSAKRWYPRRFAEVADRLHERYGLKIVLVGSSGERPIAEEIAAAMRAPAENLAGKTSVRQMMAVVADARLVVTNDSGPMHVAAAFGVPIVALFGPTDPRTTSPWTRKAVVVRKQVFCSPCLLRHCPIDHRCMKRIAVEDVMQGVDFFLRNPS